MHGLGKIGRSQPKHEAQLQLVGGFPGELAEQADHVARPLPRIETVATDEVGGANAYQVSTSYTPEQMRGLLAQLNSTAPVAAQVWDDTSSHLIRKAVLTGAFGDGGLNATVQVDITGFDAPVSITSPIASSSRTTSPNT